jgi:hypothetical protein
MIKEDDHVAEMFAYLSRAIVSQLFFIRLSEVINASKN